MAIAYNAIKLGVDVYRPVVDGTRYDLIFDLESELTRVQCKWATRVGNVVQLRCYSCRRNGKGYVKRAYTSDEIDAFAAYCPDLDRCYFLPLATFPRRRQIQLRLAPTRNNQRERINWAEEFTFEA